MTAPEKLPWLRGLPPRPLCDVPWLGNVTVAEDGNVQMCCFSPTVAGNVYEQSFAEIWNGEILRRVRRALARQEIPPECRTPSCPVLRGDRRHFLLDRAHGPHREEESAGIDPYAEWRAALAGSDFLAEDARLLLRLAAPSPVPALDLYVCLTTPAGDVRFLPELGSVPMPLQEAVSLESVRTIEIARLQLPPGLAPGRYEVCGALFLAEQSPLVESNCCWSRTIFLDA